MNRRDEGDRPPSRRNRGGLSRFLKKDTYGKMYHYVFHHGAYRRASFYKLAGYAGELSIKLLFKTGSVGVMGPFLSLASKAAMWMAVAKPSAPPVVLSREQVRTLRDVFENPAALRALTEVTFPERNVSYFRAWLWDSKIPRAIRTRAWAPLSSLIMIGAGVAYIASSAATGLSFGLLAFGLSKIWAHLNIFQKLMPDSRKPFQKHYNPRAVRNGGFSMLSRQSFRLARDPLGGLDHVSAVFQGMSARANNRAFLILAGAAAAVFVSGVYDWVTKGFSAKIASELWLGGFIFKANHTLAEESDFSKYSDIGCPQQTEALRRLGKVIKEDEKGVYLSIPGKPYQFRLRMNAYEAEGHPDGIMVEIAPINDNRAALYVLKSYLSDPIFDTSLHDLTLTEPGEGEALRMIVPRNTDIAYDLVRKSFKSKLAERISDPLTRTFETALQKFEDFHQMRLRLYFNGKSLTITPRSFYKKPEKPPSDKVGTLAYLDGMYWKMDMKHSRLWERMDEEKRLSALEGLKAELQSIFGEAGRMHVRPDSIAFEPDLQDAGMQDFMQHYVRPLQYGRSLGLSPPQQEQVLIPEVRG